MCVYCLVDLCFILVDYPENNMVQRLTNTQRTEYTNFQSETLLWLVKSAAS